MESPKQAPEKRTSLTGNCRSQSKGKGYPNPSKEGEGRAKWEQMCRPKGAVLGHTEAHTQVFRPVCVAEHSALGSTRCTQ